MKIENITDSKVSNTSSLEKTINKMDEFEKSKEINNEELGISQGFPANGQGAMFDKPVAMRECEDLNFYPTEEFFGNIEAN